MTNDEYNPPKIWKWDKENGGKFANINRQLEADLSLPFLLENIQSNFTQWARLMELK